MKRDRIVLIRGIGVGMVIAASLFYFATLLTPPKTIPFVPMTDEAVIERATTMGMVFPEDEKNTVQDQEPTDETTTTDETPTTNETTSPDETTNP